MSFTFHCPTKIIVSQDAGADLAREIANIPDGPIFVLTDKGVIQAGLAAPIIRQVQDTGREIHTFSDIPGNPNEPDVRRALDALGECKPAALVALGGGSVIDTAKAAGLLLTHPGVLWEDLQWGRASITRPGVPVLAVPTTAGTGSEVTHVAVIGDRRGFKRGVVHPAVFPRAAILDGALTLSLPSFLTAATGMDALVHTLEAYLGKRANPITDALALTALRDLARTLPEVTHNGSNLEARRTVALAATLAGVAMDQAGLGLDHALCGPLAANYHLHHGLGVAVLLPATLDYDAEAIPAARWAPLRDALGLDAGAQPAALGDWARVYLRRLGLPVRLRELRLESVDVDQMAQEATRMAMIGNNIRPADLQDCKRVLEAAW